MSVVVSGGNMLGNILYCKITPILTLGKILSTYLLGVHSTK